MDLAAGPGDRPYPVRVASRGGAGKDGRVKYWEDFAVGEVIELGSCSITEAEVLAFARKYDPQPFHTDRRRRGGASSAGSSRAAGTPAPS